MPEFLDELDVSRIDATVMSGGRGALAGPRRLPSILVAEDETCFVLYRFRVACAFGPACTPRDLTAPADSAHNRRLAERREDDPVALVDRCGATGHTRSGRR